MNNQLNTKAILTSTTTSLPNLIVIGAMKCGTSSLHQYLNLHPQIQMSQFKELDFFIQEKNWNKGIDWYRSNFSQSADIIGESSPNYTKRHVFREVPARMSSSIPDAKLIYIVRDPIKRIISHYTHQYIDRCEHLTISEALADLENNHYIKSSFYYWQMEHFLDYYSPDKILVISLEDLSQSPEQTLSQVFDFLKVDSSFKHTIFDHAFHQTKQKKRLSTLGKQVANLPAGYRFINMFSSLFNEKLNNPIIEQDILKRIKDILQEDVNQLRAFTGNDFANWSI
jgi:hypothetical protein